MKKLISSLLVLALMLCGSLSLAEETAVEDVDISGAAAYHMLRVGTVNAMSGNFMGSLWESTTSDCDVQKLLHGYSLTVWDNEAGVYKYDETVVNGSVKTQEADGSHSLYLHLNENLTFSDGTPITAADYAFTLLLALSPEAAALGCRTQTYNYIYGAADYNSGASNILSGVSVQSEYVLMVRISAEALPNFFELGMLSIVPYPISVIAPGCRVADDGNGAYICDENGEDTLFTSELLEKTLLDEESGYKSHPQVVSGPYVLTSYADQRAEFDINPCYAGNENGVQPVIDHLVFCTVDGEQAVEALENGEIDLLNKTVLSDKILEGFALSRQDTVDMYNYARSGCAFIAFCCEKETVASTAVRNAIAECLDADAILQAYTGSFGLRNEGYYGLGQWMVQLIGGTVEPPIPEDDDGTAEQAWEEMSLDELTAPDLDTASAAEILDRDGWTVNGDGIREKEINGKTVALDLTLYYPEGSRMGELLQRYFVPNLQQVGIRLTLTELSKADWLAAYQSPSDRDCDMIFAATNFNINFDPAPLYEIGGEYNYGAVEDEELYRLALDMVCTESGEVLEYCQKWLAFQQRWLEVLPAIPLYTNVYFDFAVENLQNYNISDDVSWAQAIVEAYMSDAALDEEEDSLKSYELTGEDELEDEEEFFDDDEEIFED